MKYLAKTFSKSPDILSIRAKKQVQKTYRKAKRNFKLYYENLNLSAHQIRKSF